MTQVKTGANWIAAVTSIAVTSLFAGAPALAEPLKIGFVVTQSGPGAVVGQDMMAGFKIGLKDAGLESGPNAGGWTEASDAAGLRIQSASSLSGLFDLEPVRLSNCNEWARLDAAAAARNSPLRHPPERALPLVASYAPNEAAEFAIQSEAYIAVCRSLGCAVEFVAEPSTNHFDLPLRLMHRDAALTHAVLAVMGLA